MAAYMVALAKITNFKPELKEYAQRSAAEMKKHGGVYIVRGPAADNVDGTILADMSAIVAEFPSMEDLQAYVKGDEYVNNIKPLREGTGEYHIGFYNELPEDQR